MRRPLLPEHSNDAMRRRVRELAMLGLWIEVQCSCQTAYVPVRTLPEKWGAKRFESVAGALRCSKRCKGRPTGLWLTNDPAAGFHSNRQPWRIKLW